MNDLYNIFDGLKIIDFKRENVSINCLKCNTQRQIMAYFEECEHFCCSKCLDELYDNYTGIELFSCFKCDKKIYNFNYK